MNKPLLLLTLVWLLAGLVGCGTGEESAPQASASIPSEAGEAPDPANSVRYLQRPFTSEQIREAMPPGLVVTLGHKMPGGEVRQRWTVVEADAEGVAIEYAGVDPAGQVVGQVQVSRSTWDELRDHAMFPADQAQRRQETRETPLGRLDGWLYTLTEEGDKVTEFFFASSLPGAPVYMKRTIAGQVELEMMQLSRLTPPS